MGPSGHCPGLSLTFPLLGLYLHDNNIKERLLDSRRGDACVALSLFFHQKMTRICDLHMFSTKAVSQRGWFHDVWVHRERRSASVPLSLVRPPNASHPVVSSTARSPGRSVLQPSSAAFSSWFLVLRPMCSSCVSGPLSLSFSSVRLRNCHGCFSCGVFLMLNNNNYTLLSQNSEFILDENRGEMFSVTLFASQMQRWILK